MSNTARTATTTTDVSGMFRVGTFYTDSTGKIVSTVAGENHVDKYFKLTPTPTSAYKIIETKELIFKNYSERKIYTSTDGLNFTAQTPITSAGTNWDGHAISHNGGYYQMLAYDGIYRSSDLKLWSKKYSVGYAFLFPIVSQGNVLVTAQAGGTNLIYSTNSGQTWTVHTEAIPEIKSICIFNGVLVVSTYESTYDEYYYTQTIVPKLMYYNLSNISANAYASYTGGNVVYNDYTTYINKMQVVGSKLYYVAVYDHNYGPPNEFLSYMTSLPTSNGWYYGSSIHDEYSYGFADYAINTAGHLVGYNNNTEFFSNTTIPDISDDYNKQFIKMYKDLDERIVIVGHRYDEPTYETYNLVFKANDISGSGWTEIPTGSYTYPQAKFNATYIGSRLK